MMLRAVTGDDVRLKLLHSTFTTSGLGERHDCYSSEVFSALDPQKLLERFGGLSLILFPFLCVCMVNGPCCALLS